MEMTNSSSQYLAASTPPPSPALSRSPSPMPDRNPTSDSSDDEIISLSLTHPPTSAHLTPPSPTLARTTPQIAPVGSPGAGSAGHGSRRSSGSPGKTRKASRDAKRKSLDFTIITPKAKSERNKRWSFDPEDSLSAQFSLIKMKEKMKEEKLKEDKAKEEKTKKTSRNKTVDPKNPPKLKGHDSLSENPDQLTRKPKRGASLDNPSPFQSSSLPTLRTQPQSRTSKHEHPDDSKKSSGETIITERPKKSETPSKKPKTQTPRKKKVSGDTLGDLISKHQEHTKTPSIEMITPIKRNGSSVGSSLEYFKSVKTDDSLDKEILDSSVSEAVGVKYSIQDWLILDEEKPTSSLEMSGEKEGPKGEEGLPKKSEKKERKLREKQSSSYDYKKLELVDSMYSETFDRNVAGNHKVWKKDQDSASLKISKRRLDQSNLATPGEDLEDNVMVKEKEKEKVKERGNEMIEVNSRRGSKKLVKESSADNLIKKVHLQRKSSPGSSRNDSFKYLDAGSPDKPIPKKFEDFEFGEFVRTQNPSNLFVLKRRLYNGSRGIVGLYTDPTGKKVAIKRISADHNLLLLHRETHALMSTFHENLIHLWGKDCFVDSSNCVWIPMEYMNGGSLQDSIRIVRQSKYGKDTIGNPLGIPEVLSLNELQIGWIISNVCKGLNYLHKLNRIHRDITSSNILLSKDARQVKIADFGFVLQIQEEEKRRSTCGTYEWMAPEILNSLPYSYSADIWSLGVVLYECAEAQTPYHGLTEIKILRQMKKGPPKLPKNKWSRDMLNFFSQCTQLSPKKRSTISQLIAHPWMTSLISDPELFNSDAFFNELSVIIHYAKADVKRRMAPYSPRK